MSDRNGPAVRSLAWGEDIAEEEFYYRRAEGRRLYIHCSGLAGCAIKDGEIVAAVLAVYDITERNGADEMRVLVETGRWRGEVTVARKDGTTVGVEMLSVARRGQQGAIMG